MSVDAIMIWLVFSFILFPPSSDCLSVLSLLPPWGDLLDVRRLRSPGPSRPVTLSDCLSTRHPRVSLSHAPHLLVTPVTLVTSNSSNTTHFVLLLNPRGTTGVRSRAHASAARVCVRVACAADATSNSVLFTEMRSPRSYVIGNVGVPEEEEDIKRQKLAWRLVLIGFFSSTLQMALLYVRFRFGWIMYSNRVQYLYHF